MARLLDVLNDEERAAQKRVAALGVEIRELGREADDVKGLIASRHSEVKKLEKEAGRIGALIDRHTAKDAERALAAYKAMKPERYDVSVYIAPGSRGVVKMYWGNRVKLIFDGDSEKAREVAQKVCDLTGQSSFKEVTVGGMSDVWTK